MKQGTIRFSRLFTYPGKMVDPVEVLRVLGNKFSAEILHAADEPKSAQQLTAELDIPLATSYRRIEELTDVGLLEETGTEFSDEGRQTQVYRRSVDTIRLDLDGRGLELTMEERPEIYDKLANVWRTLDEREDRDAETIDRPTRSSR